MIYAQLNESSICIGYGNLSGYLSDPSLVHLPEGWDKDFLWRKWENGAWSTEKFEPVPPDPGPDLPTEISKLKEENEKLKQRFAQMDGDFFGFQQFYFEKNPQDA